MPRAAETLYTQTNRPFRLTTSLGADFLLFLRMTGREALNELFSYEIEALTLVANVVDSKKLLGQSATVFMGLESGSRYVNGIITKCTYVSEDKVFKQYILTLRPKLWLLTLNTSSRIFQSLTIPDILKQVLTNIQINNELTRDYQPVNYCVQYRETDFNFASRLMEQEGICYYFQHADGKHTMVLTDNNASHPTNSYSPIPYLPVVENDYPKWDCISEWHWTREIPLKTVVLWDAHFGLPKKHIDVTKNAPGNVLPAVAQGEFYDFPGGGAKPFDPVNKGGGDQPAELQKVQELNNVYAGIRIEEANTQFDTMTGVGKIIRIFAGATFNLENDPLISLDTTDPYLVLSCEFTVQGHNYRSAGAFGAGSADVNITALPTSNQYRPPRVARKPVVPGPQTAFVVGPAGQEIFVDKYGRVKVQFNWDRVGTSDADSSCWLRVAQIWAGQAWGTMAIPRIGHEVIVAFLEGDPDQPIITGSVYNAANMPPYTLPDNMTRTTIKSRSSMGGTADNFNEIRFEDKKGSEEIFVQAEKDFNRVVENNDTLKVGSDKADDGSRTTTIYKDETLTVTTGNRDTTISKGNETLTVSEGNRTTTISKGNETLSVSEGKRDTTIEGNDTLTINTGDRAATISTGNETLTISQGNETVTISKGNRSTTISQGSDSLTISKGDWTVSLGVGSVSIEAAKGITLKVGANSIAIDTSGITLQAAKVSVTGQAQVSVSGAQVSISGSAVTSISGGMVQIN